MGGAPSKAYPLGGAAMALASALLVVFLALSCRLSLAQPSTCSSTLPSSLQIAPNVIYNYGWSPSNSESVLHSGIVNIVQYFQICDRRLATGAITSGRYIMRLK